MDENANPILFGVSDFIAVLNQTLEYSFPSVHIQGEVASFKVNQGKYVFFDLKDQDGTLNCFMSVWQLRVPIEDGMKVIISGVPKMTKWGKFSITVQAVRPHGEGSLRKSFDILKAKLEKEGLFSLDRKRQLPSMPRHIGVITSTGAAGYADFIKVLDDRWSGVVVDVAHVQVQGNVAPDQMIRALRYFNEQETVPEVLVIIRGGGSADDLSAFNDELFVREIAGSRIPTLVGVGHEVDMSFADLVADVRAATPSNAAQLLVPDRREVSSAVTGRIRSIVPSLRRELKSVQQQVLLSTQEMLEVTRSRFDQTQRQFTASHRALQGYDPYAILRRGYAIVRGPLRIGAIIEIEQQKHIIQAEIQHYDKK